MNNMEKDINGFGKVILRSITINDIIEAEKLAGISKHSDYGYVFTNKLLSSMFVEPQMDSGDIDKLNEDILIELIDVAVKDLEIEKVYCKNKNKSLLRLIFYNNYKKQYKKSIQFKFPEIINDMSNLNFNLELPKINYYNNIFGKLNKVIEKHILPAITEASRSLYYNITKNNELYEDIKLTFIAADWPLPQSISDKTINSIVRMHKKGKSQYISNKIISYYHRQNFINMRQMVDSWNSNMSFIPRMHIFYEALDAHLAKRYTLTVPILFIQIEGILREYVNKYKLKTNYRFKDLYEAVIGDTDSHFFSIWAISEVLSYYLQNHVYPAKSFDNLEEIKKPANTRQISRHTVIHGVAIKYDKPIYSLKLFLLLDALNALKYFLDAKQELNQ